MKLTLIGGGGSRTPLLYHGLMDRDGSLGPTRLVLHDTDPSRLERVEKVLSGMDEETGDGIARESTTEIESALEGADFVLTAIRAGGFEARRLDEAIPLAHGVVGQETVGPGGFALAARNIPALVTVAERMRALCPDAWLINLSNPAGVATQALAPLLDGRVVGVCDSPLALGRGVARALGVGVDELHLEYAGLNHLGWLSGAWLDGHDVLPGLIDSRDLERIEEACLIGCHRVRALGALPNEYLYFYERPDVAVRNIRSGGVPRGEFLDDQQRTLGTGIDTAPGPREALALYKRSLQVRNDTYMSVESGIERTPDDDAFRSAGGYHEMALSVVDAIRLDRPAALIVNTPNRGAIPFLDDDDVVEVTSIVRRAGVFPTAARVPDERRALIMSVKEFERATLDALESGSINAARDALARHPLVGSRDSAERILHGYVEAMPAVAAAFGRAR